MPEKQSQPGGKPTRDAVNDEDGPHSSRHAPRDRAQDANTSTRRRPSQDVDPDSAESLVDRDDTIGDDR
jgi:hypothetical protein